MFDCELKDPYLAAINTEEVRKLKKKDSFLISIFGVQIAEHDVLSRFKMSALAP